jgi:hypothetical protein
LALQAQETPFQAELAGQDWHRPLKKNSPALAQMQVKEAPFQMRPIGQLKAAVQVPFT